MSRHPLDRSAAFTALLEFAPWFGQAESRQAGAIVTAFLVDFYRSGSKDMAEYARGWAAGNGPSGAELAARRTAAAAVLADYQRAAETADVAERAMWGARLADTLAYLLDGLGAAGGQS